MNKLNRFIADLLISPQRSAARHLLLQLLLVMISSSVLWEPASGDTPDRGRIIVWLVYYGALNGLVYVNIYVLARKFLLHNRLFAYCMAAAGLVAALLGVIGVLQSFLPDQAGTEAAPEFIGLISSVAAVGLLFAGTSALVLFRQWMIAAGKRRELESLNLATELQMLKNQINPHFLFNMLNNCYLLVRKGRPEAAEVLLRLEELLRYQIGGVDRDTVTLKEEMEFLNGLLELENIRRDNFRFTIDDRTERETILLPPMIFIPFVENAIKHNSDSENLSYVEISIERQAAGVVFSCVNSKPGTPAVAARAGTGGLGLRNIRRRLELLFPQRHKLTVDQDERQYRVTLKLEL